MHVHNTSCHFFPIYTKIILKLFFSILYYQRTKLNLFSMSHFNYQNVEQWHNIKKIESSLTPQ